MTTRSHQGGSVALLAAAILATTLLGGARLEAAVPTLVTITVDGDVSDWSAVLRNPLNTSRDGDGSTIPCANSTDRDCPIDAPEHDLARFAWTWDDTNFCCDHSQQRVRRVELDAADRVDTVASQGIGHETSSHRLGAVANQAQSVSDVA